VAHEPARGFREELEDEPEGGGLRPDDGGLPGEVYALPAQVRGVLCPHHGVKVVQVPVSTKRRHEHDGVGEDEALELYGVWQGEEPPEDVLDLHARTTWFRLEAEHAAEVLLLVQRRLNEPTLKRRLHLLDLVVIKDGDVIPVEERRVQEIVGLLAERAGLAREHGELAGHVFPEAVFLVVVLEYSGTPPRFEVFFGWGACVFQRLELLGCPEMSDNNLGLVIGLSIVAGASCLLLCARECLKGRAKAARNQVPQYYARRRSPGPGYEAFQPTRVIAVDMPGREGSASFA